MRITLAEAGEQSDGPSISPSDAARGGGGARAPEARAALRAAVAALHPARGSWHSPRPLRRVAHYVAMLLGRAGRAAQALDASGIAAGRPDAGLGPGTRCSCSPWPRYREVAALFAEARRLGLTVVLVTDSLDRSLARHARVVVPARRGRARRVACTAPPSSRWRRSRWVSRRWTGRAPWPRSTAERAARRDRRRPPRCRVAASAGGARHGRCRHAAVRLRGQVTGAPTSAARCGTPAAFGQRRSHAQRMVAARRRRRSAPPRWHGRRGRRRAAQAGTAGKETCRGSRRSPEMAVACGVGAIRAAPAGHRPAARRRRGIAAEMRGIAAARDPPVAARDGRASPPCRLMRAARKAPAPPRPARGGSGAAAECENWLRFPLLIYTDADDPPWKTTGWTS